MFTIKKIHLTLSILSFALLANFAQAEKVMATITSLSGNAKYIEPGSLFAKTLKEGSTLPLGTVIKTGQGSEVLVAIAPGAAVQIKENTTVNLKDMAYSTEQNEVIERKARIELSEGTIINLLEHNQPKITDFRVITPDGTAAARGTYYAVTVIDGKTFVAVEEGKVGVRLNKEDA